MKCKVVQARPLPERSDEMWWRRPESVKYAYAEQPHGIVHYRIVTPAQTRHAPLLIIHQSGSSGRCYENLAATLGNDRTVLAPDTPGFGASDPLPFAPSIADFAQVTVNLLDQLGFDLVDVLGDSTGTKTAVELAVKWQSRIRRVVLHSGAVFSDDELKSLRARDAIIERPQADGSHIMMRWDWRRQNMGPAPVFLREMEMVEALRSGPFAGHGHHAALAYDMAGNLQNIRQRVCVLRLKDLWDGIGRSAKLIPDCEMIELPEFGRESILMRYEHLAEIISEFLDRE